MAQWQGQFSGKTHASKVKDLEKSLRKSVSAYQNESGSKPEKGKSVVRLARRLLRARIRLLKSREGDRVTGPASDEDRLTGEASQQSRLAQTIEGGVPAILEEFGADELASMTEDLDGNQV